MIHSSVQPEKERGAERRVTIKQYAEMKKISTKTVRRYIKAGILKVYQVKPNYPIEIIVVD